MTANVWANVGGISQALPMDTLLGTPDQLLGMNAAGTAGHWKAIKFNDAANQLWNVDGVTAAPAYSFASNPGYGMYLKTGNTLGFTIAGVDKALVTVTGINSTPIGATTPSTGAFTSLTNAGDFTTTAGKFDGTTAVAGNVNLILRAPAGGDLFRIFTLAAGSGVGLQGMNSAQSDYAPVGITGNSVTINSRTGVGTSSTSAVFTPGTITVPLITTSGATNLFLDTNGGTGTNGWLLDNATKAWRPTPDNTNDIGVAGGTVRTILVHNIDTSAGNLAIKVAGDQSVVVSKLGTPTINFVGLYGAVTGQGPLVLAQGSDANVTLALSSQNTGSINCYTDSEGNLQFQVLRTGSVTRNGTVTGSNGGNVQWGSTGGSGSDFTSATIRFNNIGTTANAANATLNAVGSNDLLRSTSSMFFKKILGDLTLDESKNIVLNSKAIRYNSRSQSDDQAVEHIGFTAEQIRDVDSRLITRDENNLPNWVQYPNYVVPLCVVAQDHEARLLAVEKAVGLIH